MCSKGGKHMKPAKSRNSSEGTIIGAGVKLAGSLKDEGPIAINGEVKGDISSNESIFVGEDAFIQGPISAQFITVSGTVEGEIKATDTLEITPTGKVSGKIDTKTLIIRPGALFIGQCKMIEAMEPADLKLTAADEILPKKK